MSRNRFAINLGKYRKKFKLSKEQLAFLVGCSDVAIGIWERGEKTPGAESLEKLADVFSVTMDDLWRKVGE